MFRKRANNNQGKTDVLSLLVFIGLFFVLLVYSNLCATIDSWIHDFWQNLRIGLNKLEKNAIVTTLFPAKSVNKDIVLIIIDDRSILGVRGLFENDRSVYAQALRNLKEMNPKAVGLDVFFATSTDETQEQDQELADAVADLREKIVIKAYRRDDKRMTLPYPELIRYALPAPSYFKNYRDKAIRSVSLIFRTEGGKIYPSFQTLLWTKFLGIKLNDVNFKDGYLNVKEEKLVKLINNEYLLLNYDKPLERFRRFSFFDLYNNNIPASELENKLVIIGFGNSMTEEKLFTPTNGDQYSPILNALTLSNLLEKGYLTPSSRTITILMTIVILVVLFFVFSFASPTLSLIITFLINIILIELLLVIFIDF